MTQFQELIWGYYRASGRDLPWRPPTLAIGPDDTLDPYLVVVSEIMLQQTQVARVLEKFSVFSLQFPNFDSLAEASVPEVLTAWQGLGYNRRVLWLRRMAQTVTRDFDGRLPQDPKLLVTLPGIGPHTAGSVAAFAFNQPAVFIETNIRRVFIHHFFCKEQGYSLAREYPCAISDQQLAPLVEAALDRHDPRQWYYALMDYGAMLGKTVTNPNRRSRHYFVQSKFEGSDRQIRSLILKQLLKGSRAQAELAQRVGCMEADRFSRVLAGLVKEGFVVHQGDRYVLSEE